MATGWGKEYDRHELHKALYQAADRLHRLRINQKDWAAELGISVPTITKIMREFVESGRIRKIGNRRSGVGVYLVADPDSKEEWQPIPQIPPAQTPEPSASEGVHRGT